MKSTYPARIALVAFVAIAAPASYAAMFDVTLSADFSPDMFVINSADGAVFGVSPADTSFSVILRIDTNMGVDSASAGDPAGTFTYAHDVWGYSATVLSASFGTKTWTTSDIVTLDFQGGIADSQLFLDAELGSGTPTLASFRLQNDGFAFFGVRACGVTCEIMQGLQIRDFNGGSFDDGFNDYVFADTYDIHVTAVPLPAAVWCFSSALIGFGALIGHARGKSRTSRPTAYF